MLVPQFSIRLLLAVTTGCAVVFSIVGLAARGSAWATAVSVGIGSLGILVLVSGLLFAVVWVFSVATSSLSRRRARSSGSPFRSESGGSPFGLQTAAGDESQTSETREEAPAAPILVDESPVAPEES
ncbi:MAG TPA: hypothetical protein VMY37_04020 [Thermoguttaceae bacterium]|nr:hypothetical protein [Thermoguttaceae bacterium]